MKTFTLNKRTKELFSADPNTFIEKAIKDYACSNPSNCLEGFDNAPIFEKPLVGIAAGDDPLFKEYKKVVHENHFLPREILDLHISENQKSPTPDLENVSVISFILPISRKTIKVNAAQKEGPSLRWNHTRWRGQSFINELSEYLVSILETMGCCAVAPELSPFYKMFILPPGGFTSNWSQRHAAYAAGLGTFSLNDGFITTKGLAMRCGSVVTNLKLQSSARPYINYLENCLFYSTGKCGKCIRRCPGGAISEKGHDKLKCFETVFEKQKPWIEGAHGAGFIGYYAGCGLCQAGVPCAERIPVKKGRKKLTSAISLI
jgi:epoxyqueuosine reductase